MRNEGIIKFLGTVTAIFLVFMVCNVAFLHIVRKQYAPLMVVRSTSSLFDLMGQIHEWSGYVEKWKTLAQENASLKSAVSLFVSTEANLQALQSENDVLRKSLGLSSRLKRELISAGIFNVFLGPDGYYALVNKGFEDGVKVGQAVTSPEGVLIGKISDSFSDSSRVMLLNNPDLSLTARVLGGETSGILRGALADGMELNLVTQSDKIVEGDTLVTTGDDLLPAGLVVGVVRHVENNDTKLFKKIMVDPKITNQRGAVAIIK